ncbi:hypothetical protein ACFODZ_01685 [Marinicella sediminis]|uniref:Cupin domain-containing protein n=1 Tax=Marinicella sediminis TaxID=1792834 RepID=A0ABV7JBZ0_9GAMM|nr:hypothetical protein [Marinicella sediminis]
MTTVKAVLDELEQHESGAFVQLLSFNQTHVGASSISGVNPVWEMHPDTEELFYVLEGKLQLTQICPQGTETFDVWLDLFV